MIKMPAIIGDNCCHQEIITIILLHLDVHQGHPCTAYQHIDCNIPTITKYCSDHQSKQGEVICTSSEHVIHSRAQTHNLWMLSPGSFR